MCSSDLNAGLDALAGGQRLTDLTSYLAVGTGSSEPSYTDTILNAEIARTNSNGGFADSDAVVGSGALVEYWSRIRTRVFTQNQANGNLAELGFFSSSQGGTMWNRQLFRDELGNPTAITKTNEDQLRVRYEYRIYPPWDDLVQEIEVNGVTTEVVNRPQLVASSGNWGSFGGRSALNILGSVGPLLLAAYETHTLPARNSYPSGTNANASSTAVQSYTPGTYYREREGRWEPSAANFATGIGVFYSLVNPADTSANTSMAFASKVTPKIMKQDTQRLIVMERWTYARKEDL